MTKWTFQQINLEKLTQFICNWISDYTAEEIYQKVRISLFSTHLLKGRSSKCEQYNLAKEYSSEGLGKMPIFWGEKSRALSAGAGVLS